MGKGTLQGVALQRQHMVVTNNSFLNDTIPNGVSALYYAYSAKKKEPKMNDREYMVKQMGFSDIFEAAKILGINANSEEDIINSIYHKIERVNPGAKPKDLVFILMESMGAEPFLYQTDKFDVLGQLNDAKSFACHFSNFDAIQSGTFPSLEGILYHTPISPLTQGEYGYKPMNWSIPLVLKKAGYHTVFFTGGRASWRNLDQSLPVQGFDEIIDAGYLLEHYPNSYMDMWGIPDEFLFQAIKDYKRSYTSEKPLFIFALTITNHPPYELPAHVISPELDLIDWKGENVDPLLLKNLQTFRYSADALGQFVLSFEESIKEDKLVIAASGDHNARTFGSYSSPNRSYLSNQVPFLLWANLADCGKQLQLPASHRDMFPTLFELINANVTFLETGRNLLEHSSDGYAAVASQFSGTARNSMGKWSLFADANQEALEFCKDDNQCDLTQEQILKEKALMALADWHIRYQLTKKAKNH